MFFPFAGFHRILVHPGQSPRRQAHKSAHHRRNGSQIRRLGMQAPVHKWEAARRFHPRAVLPVTEREHGLRSGPAGSIVREPDMHHGRIRRFPLRHHMQGIQHSFRQVHMIPETGVIIAGVRRRRRGLSRQNLCAHIPCYFESSPYPPRSTHTGAASMTKCFCAMSVMGCASVTRISTSPTRVSRKFSGEPIRTYWTPL